MQWARKFWLLTLACRKRLKLLKILFLASVLWSKITPDRQLFVRKNFLAKNTILHPLTVGSPSSEDPDLDSLLKNMDVLAGFRFCRVFHCKSLWIRNIKKFSTMFQLWHCRTHCKMSTAQCIRVIVLYNTIIIIKHLFPISFERWVLWLSKNYKNWVRKPRGLQSCSLFKKVMYSAHDR